MRKFFGMIFCGGCGKNDNKLSPFGYGGLTTAFGAKYIDKILQNRKKYKVSETVSSLNNLRYRLEEGIGMLCSQQQGVDGVDSDLEDVVKDIGAALLGRSITIGRKLSYPAKDNSGFENLCQPICVKCGRVYCWEEWFGVDKCWQCRGKLNVGV